MQEVVKLIIIEKVEITVTSLPVEVATSPPGGQRGHVTQQMKIPTSGSKLLWKTSSSRLASCHFLYSAHR